MTPGPQQSRPRAARLLRRGGRRRGLGESAERFAVAPPRAAAAASHRAARRAVRPRTADPRLVPRPGAGPRLPPPPAARCRRDGGARSRAQRRQPRRAARHPRRVRRLRAEGHGEPPRVRRRQSGLAADAGRRGAGRRRGPAGAAVRRPLRQLLDRMLAAIGLDRSKVYIANIVPWRPPGNRTPTPQETQICLPFIQRQIELGDPDVLVTLGQPSTGALLGIAGHHQEPRALVPLQHRHARDPRHADAASGLSAAHAAGKRLAWRDFLAIKKALAASRACRAYVAQEKNHAAGRQYDRITRVEGVAHHGEAKIGEPLRKPCRASDADPAVDPRALAVNADDDQCEARGER